MSMLVRVMAQPNGPYDDIETADGLLPYAYREGDPNGGDDRKLRRAADLDLPFIADTRDVCTRYGIQAVHGWNLELPKHVAELPDRNLRTQRFTTFTRF